jgi:hypothetical protein
MSSLSVGKYTAMLIVTQYKIFVKRKLSAAAGRLLPSFPARFPKDGEKPLRETHFSPKKSPGGARAPEAKKSAFLRTGAPCGGAEEGFPDNSLSGGETNG